MEIINMNIVNEKILIISILTQSTKVDRVIQHENCITLILKEDMLCYV